MTYGKKSLPFEVSYTLCIIRRRRFKFILDRQYRRRISGSGLASDIVVIPLYIGDLFRSLEGPTPARIFQFWRLLPRNSAIRA